MSDGHGNPQAGVNNTAIIIPIAALILILSIIPPFVILVCMRIVHRKSKRPHTLRMQITHTWAPVLNMKQPSTFRVVRSTREACRPSSSRPRNSRPTSRRITTPSFAESEMSS